MPTAVSHLTIPVLSGHWNKWDQLKWNLNMWNTTHLKINFNYSKNFPQSCLNPNISKMFSNA